MDTKEHYRQSPQKPPLEMRDSGIACYTPSPPPKRPSLPRPSSHQSRRKELKHRVPSREFQGEESSPDRDAINRVVLPPRLDLRGIIGDDSDDDNFASTDRSFKSDDHPHTELEMAVETPSPDLKSRMSDQKSIPEGYQTDVECSSSSPAPSSCSSVGSAGLHAKKWYASGGVEEESEGSVLKVKLKLKPSHPASGRGRGDRERKGRSGKSSPPRTSSAGSVEDQKGHEPLPDGRTISKYAPLPGIGHPSDDRNATEMPRDPSASAASEGSQASIHHDHKDVREQRIKVLGRCNSQADITSRTSSVPLPPPQSAKTVSRREMRKQQFARRKSASQAEAASRSSTRSSAQPNDPASNVLLALRLPSGTRVQNLFKSSDLLSTVAQFAVKEGNCSLKIHNVCLVTNDMPKRELTDLEVTVEEAGLRDRTLLNLQELD